MNNIVKFFIQKAEKNKPENRSKMPKNETKRQKAIKINGSKRHEKCMQKPCRLVGCASPASTESTG
jgi:hypothetical protein